MHDMASRPSPTLAKSLNATLDWWREAGVDRTFVDEPATWLAPPQQDDAAVEEGPAASTAQTAPEPELVQIGGDQEVWPQDLAAFREWWLSEPSLAHGDPAARVAPSGEQGAALMVLVPMPEEGDREDLLSGRAGKLLRSFAQAAGIGPEHLYFASALPRHMELPDWKDLAKSGLGDIVRHHCKLVQPLGLLVLGRDLSTLLHSSDGPSDSEQPTIDIGRPLPVLTSYAPERLLEHARLRAGLWQKWLDWSGQPGPETENL